MAVTTGLSSFGTLLKIGDGEATEVFTTVAEVHDISGPGFTLSTLQATHHESPGAIHEYLPGLRDTKPVSFEIAFVPQGATHSFTTGLLGDQKARTRRNFQIVFTDASTTWEFAAFITDFELGLPLDGMMTASIELKPTGEVAETTV